MKQVLQYRRSGQTRVVDVPAPLTPAGGVLVRNHWSLISPGTERMLVEAGGSNLINTARQRPDLVKQVLDRMARDGVLHTVEAVKNHLDVAIPLGYSCAGEVLDVGGSVAEFQRGDRVACAGAGQANHAEIIAVARNLTVKIPKEVSDEDAAFVTVGAIALQGIRVADVRVGEACIVIGLGLVGQLTAQLLKAAGCKVFGIDTAADKVALAQSLGADQACLRTDVTLHQQVSDFTFGRGADAILITAATSSNDPVQLAAHVARDRAVVVAVGMVGLDVPRNAYYEKELDLRLSRSYGPGRYDRTYEEDGVDYPVGYVRWTEQRNMEAFLQLVGEGKVAPSGLVTHRVPIADAEHAYAIVVGDVSEPSLGILLQYPHVGDAAPRVDAALTATHFAPAGAAQIGMVGAGSFARSVLLPRLKGIRAPMTLRGVATATGLSATQAVERFGFSFAATDWHQVVDDPQTNAVLVATRHDVHAEVAAAALRAGKSVFLEKPMALTDTQLDDLMAAWRTSGRILMLGFNRRFAPATQAVRAFLRSRRGPLVISYRVCAGRPARTSWVLDPQQGGGRVIGEICHMLDLMQYLAQSRISRVYAHPVGSAAGPEMDDVLVSAAFADGSIGNVTYTSSGDSGLAKEYLEVFADGRAAVFDDFRTTWLYRGGRRQRAQGTSRTQDKGHATELRLFVEAVVHGRPSPIDAEEAAHVTRATFAAVESMRVGVPVDLGGE